VRRVRIILKRELGFDERFKVSEEESLLGRRNSMDGQGETVYWTFVVGSDR
jgi:hypothetical protein